MTSEIIKTGILIAAAGALGTGAVVMTQGNKPVEVAHEIPVPASSDYDADTYQGISTTVTHITASGVYEYPSIEDAAVLTGFAEEDIRRCLRTGETLDGGRFTQD